MSWGTIQLGRLTLRETYSAEERVNASTRERTLNLQGQEAMPPLSLAQVRQRAADIMGLAGTLVPVTFTNKPQHSGYYTVRDSGASVDVSGGVETVDWTASLTRIGPEDGVDLESRLAGVTRKTDPAITLAPTRWHAPAGGAYGYHVGAATPTLLTRAGADGPVTVYRSLPAGVNPRWSSPLAGYGTGRVRVLDANGAERTGPGVDLDPDSWTLTNGLVRVTPGSLVTLHVDAWDGAGWEPKDWNISIGSQGAADAVTAWSAATVLRNEYEAVTIRLVRDRAPGRALLDLTLRRGSRFVEGYLQVATAATLALWPATAEAATAVPADGYMRATANDAAGNRYVAGSAQTWTARLASSGGLYRDATARWDFFVGAAVGGSAAVAGDTPADLAAQYLAAPVERTMAVAR